MGFLRKILEIFGLDGNLIELLTAHIVTDEEYRYFISFSRHHPQLQPPEFVRLVLHYYAKILYLFDPSDPAMSFSAFMLKNMIQSLIDKGIRKNSNILRDAGIDDVAKIVSSPPTNMPRDIIATLFYVDEIQRHIKTKIPLNVYVQHLVFSVFALIQAALDEMDQDCIDVLNCSLSIMNDIYNSGRSYSQLKNLATIPTTAYISTVIARMSIKSK